MTSKNSPSPSPPSSPPREMLEEQKPSIDELLSLLAQGLKTQQATTAQRKGPTLADKYLKESTIPKLKVTSISPEERSKFILWENRFLSVLSPCQWARTLLLDPPDWRQLSSEFLQQYSQHDETLWAHLAMATNTNQTLSNLIRQPKNFKKGINTLLNLERKLNPADKPHTIISSLKELATPIYSAKRVSQWLQMANNIYQQLSRTDIKISDFHKKAILLAATSWDKRFDQLPSFWNIYMNSNHLSEDTACYMDLQNCVETFVEEHSIDSLPPIKHPFKHITLPPHHIRQKPIKSTPTRPVMDKMTTSSYPKKDNTLPPVFGCFHCGYYSSDRSNLHLSSNCPQKAKGFPQNKKGELQLKKYQDWRRRRNQTPNSSPQTVFPSLGSLTLSLNTTYSPSSTTLSFLIDTGNNADHCIPHHLKTLLPDWTPHVSPLDAYGFTGQKAIWTGSGTLYCYIKTEKNHQQPFKISVRTVKGTSQPMLAYSKLFKKQISLQLYPTSALVLVNDDTTLPLQFKDGLPMLEVTIARNNTSITSISAPKHSHVADSLRWHHRAHHANQKTICDTAKLVTGMEIHSNTSPPFNVSDCDHCIKAKIGRNPIPKATGESNYHYGYSIWHWDAIPIKPSQLSSKETNILVATSSTRHQSNNQHVGVSVAIVTDTTFDGEDILNDFETLIKPYMKNHGGISSIEKFYTDGASSFTKGSFQKAAQKRSIRISHTSPGTPQTNGLVEKRIANAVDATIAVLSWAQLDSRFITHAMTDHFRKANKLITKSGHTPLGHFAKDEKAVNWTHEKVFGCVAYAYIPKGKRTKFSEKAKAMINLGLHHNNVYSLYDPDTGRISYSSNVIMKEDIPGGTLLTNNSPITPDDNISELFEDAWINQFFPQVSDDSDSDSEQEELSPTLDDPDSEESKNQTPLSSFGRPLPRRSSRENLGKPPPRLNFKLVQDYPVSQYRLPDASSPSIQQASEQDISNLSSRLPQIYLEDLPRDLDPLEIPIPTSYHELITSPKHSQFLPYWKDAMTRELSSFISIGAFKPVQQEQLPPDAEVVNGLWTFTLKTSSNNRIERFKARWCIRGDKMDNSLYHSQFSPTTLESSMWALLHLAATRNNLQYIVFDISNAYLNCKPSRPTFVYFPQGFKPLPGHLLEICANIYGKIDAGRLWFKEITNTFKQIGDSVSQINPCLFFHNSVNDSFFRATVTNVDDMLIVGTPEAIHDLKQNLLKKYSITEKTDSYLGIQLTEHPQGILAHQTNYIKKMICDLKLESSNSKATPLPAGAILTSAKSPTPDSPEWVEVKQFNFPSKIGKVAWSTKTHPEAKFSVSALGRYTSNPSKTHIRYLNNTASYLRNIEHHGLFFDSNSNDQIRMFTDADWAGDIDDRKSQAGILIFIGTSLIFSSSTKIKHRTDSSCTAEIAALYLGLKELIPIRTILIELGILQLEPPPIPVYIDNASTIAVTTEKVGTKHLKHIQLKYLSVKDAYANGIINLFKVDSKYQLADLLTKPLNKTRLQDLLRIISPQPESSNA